MPKQFSWEKNFTDTFQKSIVKYKEGIRDLDKFFEEIDLAFFNDIGYQPREFFDFVEDYCDVGAPSPETALLIASVRRDFFLVIQKGKWSENQITSRDLPKRGKIRRYSLATQNYHQG